MPQIGGNLDMPGLEDLAHAFNVPVILHSAIRDGSLREYADQQKIPVPVYEAGEALHFNELSIRTGINGILGVMVALDIIQAHQFKLKKCHATVTRISYWLRAPLSGILRTVKKQAVVLIKVKSLLLFQIPLKKKNTRSKLLYLE